MDEIFIASLMVLLVSRAIASNSKLFIGQVMRLWLVLKLYRRLSLLFFIFVAEI